MSILQVTNLSKNFFNRNLFEHWDLQLDEGERVAILGENGAGKSTFCRILVGEEKADEGEVTFASRVTKAYLSQQIVEEDLAYAWQTKAWLKAEEKLHELEEKMPRLEGEALEKLLHQYHHAQIQFDVEGGYDFKSKVANSLAHLSLDPEILEQPLSSCSGGEKMRIALAKILAKKADLLILDEPTNHLDLASIEWLTKYLKKFKGTLLFVSHDRAFIQGVATRCIFLEKNQILSFKGNFEEAFAQREQREQTLLLEQEELTKQLAYQSKVAQTLRSHRKISSWKSRLRVVSKLQDKLEETKAKTLVQNQRMRIQVLPPNREACISGKSLLIHLKNASKFYGERCIFKNLDFEIYGKDKLLLLGPNGSGKSTLLHILIGQDLFYEGELQIKKDLQMSYMGQNLCFEDEQLSLFAYMQAIMDGKEEETRHRLAMYGFRSIEIYKRIEVLSGGERARLYLCSALYQQPDLLILDEPTNHLDLYSRTILEEAIAQYEGAVIAVSHDRYFIERFAQRFCSIENLGIREYEHLQEALDQQNYLQSKRFNRLAPQNMLEHNKQTLKTSMLPQGKVEPEVDLNVRTLELFKSVESRTSPLVSSFSSPDLSCQDTALTKTSIENLPAIDLPKSTEIGSTETERVAETEPSVLNNNEKTKKPLWSGPERRRRVAQLQKKIRDSEADLVKMKEECKEIESHLGKKTKPEEYERLANLHEKCEELEQQILEDMMALEEL